VNYASAHADAAQATAKPRSNTMILGLLITLVVLAITGYTFWKVWLPMIHNANTLMSNLSAGAAEQRALLTSGVPGQARVLNVQGTGTLVNHDPQVVLDLEVSPAPGAQTFRARCTSIVSQIALPRVQPGCIVAVRFDPMNPQRVALAV